jgi:hypothetical protein
VTVSALLELDGSIPPSSPSSASAKNAPGRSILIPRSIHPIGRSIPFQCWELERLEELKEKAQEAMLSEASKHEITRLLETAPGIGPVRAAQLLAGRCDSRLELSGELADSLAHAALEACQGGAPHAENPGCLPLGLLLNTTHLEDRSKSRRQVHTQPLYDLPGGKRFLGARCCTVVLLARHCGTGNLSTPATRKVDGVMARHNLQPRREVVSRKAGAKFWAGHELEEHLVHRRVAISASENCTHSIVYRGKVFPVAGFHPSLRSAQKPWEPCGTRAQRLARRHAFFSPP